MSQPSFLAEARRELRKHKTMAERALSQVDDEGFTRLLDPEANSLALIVKHVAGNMRSRWTDFLESDGEKTDRHRDGEFELAADDSRAAVMARWEDGWRRLFAAVEPLSDDDLARQVTIRGEPHTVLQAVLRQLTHYASHVGQIVFLAKHLAGPRWQSLSIPRGRSADWDVAKDGQSYLVTPPPPR
jgi:uncharacterized protein DUF1572